MTKPAGTSAIIGREHPSATAAAEVARLVDSHGGLLLVTGEAGIGKTTLIGEAAEQARRLGVLVLGGSCWDSDRAPDYWPWVQVIRALRRAVPAAEWREITAAAGPALATLLGEALAPAGPPLWAEPEQPEPPAPDAFRLADAVTTALVVASQARAVMVILDDLHWADPASLRLLEFAGQHTWFERLLLAGTYRDAEVDAVDGPVRAGLAPIVAKATTVTLTGLDRDDVAALIERVAGRQPDAGVVAEIHRQTGGNPFFVEQTARLWQVEGELRAVPPGVRDAVRRRVALLPPRVVDVLTAASVLGREFDRSVLAGLAHSEADTDAADGVDERLEVAVTARLVAPAGPGRFAFVHDLVRDTLYSGLSEEERRARHAAVVASMKAGLLPAELARHAVRAGDDLPAAIRIDALLAAARDASARLASQESAGHFRRALALATEPVRRARIALELGLQLDRTGEREQARAPLNEAATIALAGDDPRLLARVAVTAHWHRTNPPGSGETPAYHAPTLLREAHRRLIEAGEPPDDEDVIFQALIARIEDLARRDADDESLTFSLWTRHDSIWGLGTARERIGLITEMRDVARRTGDRDSELFGTSLAWVALLELGEPAYLDQFTAFMAAAEPLAASRYQLSTVIDGSIIAAFHGDFERSADLLARFDDHDSSEFAYMHHHLHWALSLLRGQYDEIDRQLAALTPSDHPYLDLVSGVTAADRGRPEDARAVAQKARNDPQAYPRYLAPLTLRLQAQVAAGVGDEDWIDELRRTLRPHRGEWLVSLFGCDISGPVEHWLAVLEVACGRWEDAVTAATAAVEAAERMDSRPWAERANAVLAQAVRRTAPSTVDVEVPEFRREGAVWRLGYDGVVIHLPDAKGLRDLHELLGRPYQDIPAVRLLEPAGGAVVMAAHGSRGDPVLDDQARARYRARLSELDSELDRAGRRGDAKRGAALEREREALLDELRRAVGLGGRSRRLGDDGERARKAVTARIRDALRKLHERHPSLAGHLRETVSTGSTCRYAPAEPVAWRLH